MTISTSCPSALRKRSRRSVEKPLSFPRTSSETSACVTWRISAAFTWVRSRFSIVAEMRAAISALARASPLSGTPRSLKTFPEPLRTEIPLLPTLVALLMIFLGSPEPRLHEVDVSLGRRDAFLRLLLKRVQHVNCSRQSDGVNGAIRVPVVVLDDLQDACAFKALEWICIWMLEARLREVERESHDVLDVLRKLAEVLLRRSHPEQGLSLLRTVHSMALLPYRPKPVQT